MSSNNEESAPTSGNTSRVVFLSEGDVLSPGHLDPTASPAQAGRVANGSVLMVTPDNSPVTETVPCQPRLILFLIDFVIEYANRPFFSTQLQTTGP